MTASTFWSDAPRNRHAAERRGIALSTATTRDAHAVRRQTTVVVAGLFLLVNVVLLASLLPGVIDTVSSVITLPYLGAPQP